MKLDNEESFLIKSRNPGSKSDSIKLIEELKQFNEEQGIDMEKEINNTPMVDSIYGIKVDDYVLSVDDVYLNDFASIARAIHSKLQDEESSKTVILKSVTTGETREEECTKEAAFHAAAMLIGYFKKRVKALNEFNRLAEARTNKMVARAKKVIKRREKKKLNKKYSK